MFKLQPQRCVQLQLRWSSRTQDALPARAGRPKRLEIPILRCTTLSCRDCSPPPWAPGGNLVGEYHALHQDPAIPRLLRQQKPQHKSVADHTTRHKRTHAQPEHRDNKLSSRVSPVQASSDARPWCSPPSVRKNCMPLHLSQEGHQNSKKGH